MKKNIFNFILFLIIWTTLFGDKLTTLKSWIFIILASIACAMIAENMANAQKSRQQPH